jgi:hypothetical protein
MSMLEFDPLMHAVIVFVIFDLIFGKKYCSGILTLIIQMFLEIVKFV